MRHSTITNDRSNFKNNGGIQKLGFLCLVVFVALFSSCNDDNISAREDCIPHTQFYAVPPDAEIISTGAPPLFKKTHPIILAVSFNPNNSDELVFLVLPGGYPTPMEIVKFNIQTSERTILTSGYFGAFVKWGKNDKILLKITEPSGFAGRVAKIDSDGKNLTIIADDGSCTPGDWDYEGDRFIYSIGFTNPTVSKIREVGGNFIDSTFRGCQDGSWQHPHFAVTNRGDGITITNPDDPSVLRYLIPSGLDRIAQGGRGAIWLDERRAFWCHTNGLYITDIVTEEHDKVRTTCNADFYYNPTYAPDIDKLILVNGQRIRDSDTTGRFITNLVMMNPDGSGEEVLYVLE